MKCLPILTFALLTVALTSAIPEAAKNPALEDKNASSDDVDLMGIMDQCNKTFVIQISYLQTLNDSGSFPDETERNPKCYIKCVLEKAEIMSAEGVFNPTRVPIVFGGDSGSRPMDNEVDMIAECGNKRAESCKCERAYQYVKCLTLISIQRKKNLSKKLKGE